LLIKLWDNILILLLVNLIHSLLGRRMIVLNILYWSLLVKICWLSLKLKKLLLLLLLGLMSELILMSRDRRR
jgi:hypothetical protein